MADICVLGLGYVGLPTASLLANAGFHVLGVDIDREIVAMLRGGKTRLEEAGLATLVSAAVNSGNLVTATEPEPADTFMICVPTPVTSAKTADLRAVEQAARSILPLLKPGNLVILESTSPIGTTRNVVGRILSESGLKPGRDFDLCYCPERVLPGNTTHELINNHRLIGGITPQSATHAQQVYERFAQGKIILTDDRTAEMCKLMENTYRDVNIALANVFARIAEDVGVNVWEAIEFANLHPRVHVLRPGPGVGGHCIPVDPWYLVEAFPEHTSLLRQARLINDTQAQRMLDQLWATGTLASGKKLAILGAAYKPDIDDPRESPAALLATAARSAAWRLASTIRSSRPAITMASRSPTICPVASAAPPLPLCCASTAHTVCCRPNSSRSIWPAKSSPMPAIGSTTPPCAGPASRLSCWALPRTMASKANCR